MKAVLVLATAALAAAQGYFVGEPDCAIPCLTDGISKAGCAPGDVACSCSKDTQSKLAGLVAPCLQSKCSAKELAQALQAGNDICSSFSAGKLTFSATPMPSSASASAASASATLSGPLLSIQTSIPSNSTASMSVPGSLSKSATASTTTAPATTTGSGGGSGTTSAAASSTSPPKNDAAAQGVAKVAGGLMAGVLGLVFAL
jgi:hypothetical protein